MRGARTSASVIVIVTVVTFVTTTDRPTKIRPISFRRSLSLAFLPFPMARRSRASTNIRRLGFRGFRFIRERISVNFSNSQSPLADRVSGKKFFFREKTESIYLYNYFFAPFFSLPLLSILISSSLYNETLFLITKHVIMQKSMSTKKNTLNCKYS